MLRQLKFLVPPPSLLDRETIWNCDLKIIEVRGFARRTLTSLGKRARITTIIYQGLNVPKLVGIVYSTLLINCLSFTNIVWGTETSRRLYFEVFDE